MVKVSPKLPRRETISWGLQTTPRRPTSTPRATSSPTRLGHWGAVHADAMQLGFVEAGEDGDAEDEEWGAFRGLDCITHHRAPAREVDGGHIHPEIDGRMHGLARGIRDVAKFEIEEDLESAGLDFSDEGRPLKPRRAGGRS